MRQGFLHRTGTNDRRILALPRRSALLGVLQNDLAPMFIDHSPFPDLLQGSKAAEAGQPVVEAAIADARGLSGGIFHGSTPGHGLGRERLKSRVGATIES
jgi:hypothetical protein